ncbi:MAG: FGGY-family carbohydrate kinase [Thermofilaceae archaeon]|nr:FGGY-family carbohydrate kinase [Thermofilaceae archaeon]MCX8180478.1 FGGY-family carbohydrate kinase [Thermofilaceae archaeon]MDW8003325.1 FGGY-family carbohydrate kinase [Thermofilaceae archaeon]
MRILAVDVGTSTIKAAVFNVKSFDFEATTSKPLKISTPQPGRAELDPEHLWKTFVDTVSEAAASFEAIDAIVLDTQMAGVVPVDASGTPLTSILTWLDTRAAGHPKRLFDGAPKVSGYNLPTLTRLLRVSGGAPGKLGKDPLSKFAWFTAEQLDVYRGTWKFLDVKGFLLNRLTGRAVITYDEASITWLADTRDPLDVRWSEGLVELFKLDSSKLPEIVKPTDVIGELSDRARRELSLKEGAKVIAGCGDVAATAVGSGAVDDFEVHAYVGTGNWFAAHVPTRRLDVSHYMGCILSAIPGRYLLIAEQQMGGAALDYMFRILKLEGPEAVKGVLEGYKIGESRLLFLPWLYGERSPVEDPRLRGALLNLSLDVSDSDILAAVVEGIALNMRWEYEYFKQLLGKEISSIRIVGGGALYDILCSALSNALEVEVVRVASAKEATLMGATTVGLVALGLGDFTVSKKLAKPEAVFKPESHAVEAFRRKFELYLEAYQRLKGLFRKLNA